MKKRLFSTLSDETEPIAKRVCLLVSSPALVIDEDESFLSLDRFEINLLKDGSTFSFLLVKVNMMMIVLKISTVHVNKLTIQLQSIQMMMMIRLIYRL